MPLKMDTTNVITHKSTCTNLLTLFKQNGELKHAGLISQTDGANA